MRFPTVWDTVTVNSTVRRTEESPEMGEHSRDFRYSTVIYLIVLCYPLGPLFFFFFFTTLASLFEISNRTPTIYTVRLFHDRYRSLATGQVWRHYFSRLSQSCLHQIWPYSSIVVLDRTMVRLFVCSERDSGQLSITAEPGVVSLEHIFNNFVWWPVLQTLGFLGVPVYICKVSVYMVFLTVNKDKMVMCSE